MYWLLFGLYWLSVFIVLVAIYKYFGTTDGTITKDTVGIFFIIAPLVPVAIIGTALYAGTFYISSKIGIDLENVEVRADSCAKRFVYGLSDCLAWIPKIFGLRITIKGEKEIRRKDENQHDYEWRRNGTGEWIKEAEEKLRAAAVYEYLQMGSDIGDGDTKPKNHTIN